MHDQISFIHECLFSPTKRVPCVTEDIFLDGMVVKRLYKQRFFDIYFNQQK